MRTRHRRRRRRTRRNRRGGTTTRAFIGAPYNESGGNYYRHNDYMHDLPPPQYQTGGSWTDSFYDPRMRPIQPIWNAGDSFTYGVKSGFNALFGQYPGPSPDSLTDQFPK